MTSKPLVTVIIPAYNAAATIDETLRSVRGQTYDHLEILVVDDGSRDNTAEIVESHLVADKRVQLIRQKNAGVAAARNNALHQARGELVAPIDADDLWHPEKIARQVAVMLASPPRVALVYNWFASIDADSLITNYSVPNTDEGDVLRVMFDNRLIGNGSTPLMRRNVVIECGGYDSGLHAAGAQGCEDVDLYLAIAENHHYAVVPDFLTGYRYTPDNMSSNYLRMTRSHRLVTDKFRHKAPDIRAAAEDAHFHITFWYVTQSLREFKFALAFGLFGRLILRYPIKTFTKVFFSKSGLFNQATKLARRLAGAKPKAEPGRGPLGGHFPLVSEPAIKRAMNL